MMRIRDEQEFRTLVMDKTGSSTLRGMAKALGVSKGTVGRLVGLESIQDHIGNRVAAKLNVPVGQIATIVVVKRKSAE